MVMRSPSLAPGSIEGSRNRPLGRMTPLHLEMEQDCKKMRSERGTPETSDVPCFYP
jgi:hypothetical protein